MTAPTAPGPRQDGSRPGRRRVLVVCFDPLGATMAGPAIRAWHLAEELSVHHDVTLASTVAAGRTHPNFAVEHLDGLDLERAAAAHDSVVAPVSVSRRHPGLVGRGSPLAIDLYIPTHLENLQPAGRLPDEHAVALGHQVGVIGDDLVSGDFFLCASERQRDFWLGALASAGRVNPATTSRDPGLRSLIAAVPFGLPASAPERAGSPLRERFAIPAADPVIVWGGGVYDWLDPVVAVRAVPLLLDRWPNLHLVFLGVRNPHPDLPEPVALASLRLVVAELGLGGTHVHLNDGWVPFDERGSWLLDADVAISTHGDHLETRFSFRTRVLDYLWARLPMVLTGGDELSDVVAEAGLGVVVGAGDVAAVADGLAAVLSDPPPDRDFAPVVARYRWDAVTEPLLRWCADARPAADLSRSAAGAAATLTGMSGRDQGAPTPSTPTPSTPTTEPSLVAAEARAERVAPGYLAKVRAAAGRLAVGPDRKGDLRAALAALEETATLDVDVPTLSRRPPVRYLKLAVRALTRWYVRYIAQQVTALGHATAGFGSEVADRTDDLDAELSMATARLAALEKRIRRLETGEGRP